VNPDAISSALSLVWPFATKARDRPVLTTVEIASAQARATSEKAARVIDAPDLAGVELRVARNHARKLAEMLRRSWGPDPRMWITPTEQGFTSEWALCIVELGRKMHAVEPRLKLDDAHAVARATTMDVRAAVGRALTQVGPRPASVRLRLEGQNEGTLWVSVNVEGSGIARTSCPVRRSRAGEEPGEFAVVEAEVDGEFLAHVGALPGAVGIELHFLESTILFTEQADKRTVRTYFLRKRQA
jgi:hypothetical protein